MDFSVTQYTKFTGRVCRFHSELTCMKVPLVEVGVEIEEYPHLSGKTINVLHLFLCTFLHIKHIAVD